MILSGDFFTVSNLVHESGSINAVLEINTQHNIFQGHFPGQPVVPGVCMLQMVKEVLETAFAKPTRVSGADNLKFLTILDPTVQQKVSIEIKYQNEEAEKIKLSASLRDDSRTYFKMSGVFIFN